MLMLFIVNVRGVGIVNDVLVILPFVAAQAEVHARRHIATSLGVELVNNGVIAACILAYNGLFEAFVVEIHDAFAPKLDTFLA